MYVYYLAAIIPLGVCTLIGYCSMFDEIKARAPKLEPHLTHWYCAAGVGVVSTVTGLVGTVMWEYDLAHMLGVVLFLGGAALWPILLAKAPKREHYALLATSLGAVVWTATGRDVWWAVLARTICMFYHVLVDFAWYMTKVTTAPPTVAKFAAWNGVTGMVHMAFAVFVLHRASDAAPVTTLLGYQQWDGNNTSVQNNYIEWGPVNLLILLPIGLQVSGVCNLVTYVLLFDRNPFMLRSVGLTREGMPVANHGNAFRTLDWLVSATIMQVVLVLMVVPPDALSLFATASATMLTMLGGYCIEYLHGIGQKGVKWVIFVVSCMAYSLTWIPIIAAMTLIQPPAMVWVAISWMMLLFSSFAVVMAIKLQSKPAHCFWYEVAYLALGSIAKQPILANLYGGITARGGGTNQERESLIIGFTVPLLLGITMLADFRQTPHTSTPNTLRERLTTNQVM
jgi:hypothetical protein